MPHNLLRNRLNNCCRFVLVNKNGGNLLGNMLSGLTEHYGLEVTLLLGACGRGTRWKPVLARQ